VPSGLGSVPGERVELGCKLDGERDWLLGRMEEKPDLTLHALLGELRDRGVRVSCDTLWQFLRAAGISFKKNRVRQRAGSA
jgi:putative transposase